MKTIGVVALLGALAGCSCPVPKPEVQVVKVPVAVPCIKETATKPQYETMDGLSDGDLVLSLTRNWLLSRKYEGELEATVAGCK